MKYNTIIPNDVVNGEGICVSFWVQGCPHQCPGCFNKETWSFFEGKDYNSSIKWEIIKLISANEIERNFSVLGGEPLCKANLPMVDEIVTAIRQAYPNIKIYLWTGYTFNELEKENNGIINHILSQIDFLIDGRFEKSKKDLNLKLRGSTNQKIYEQTNGEWHCNE